MQSSMNDVHHHWPQLNSTLELNSPQADNSQTTFNDVSDPFLNHTLEYSPLLHDGDTTSSPVTSTANEGLVLPQRIANGVDFWVPPILFLGTAANILVVMVMRSKQFRHISTSFYICVSAVVDTVGLFVLLPAHYLYVNFPRIFDTVRDDHIMCSFFHFFGWVSSNLGVFLTVAMTVDRSLAIQFPLKAPTLCTVRRAKIVTLCLLLLEILKNGHLAVTTRVAPIDVTATLCDVDKNVSEGYRLFYEYWWPYVTNVSLLLAFIVIIIGNIIITVHVKRSEDSKDMGKGAKSAGGSQPGKTSSKSRQLSMMLIIDSVSVIICTLPFSIYIMLANSFQLFEDSPQGKGWQNLVFSITFYLLYINRCANFFLYCLSGSRFRQTLKEILSRKSPSQIAQSVVSSGKTLSY